MQIKVHIISNDMEYQEKLTELEKNPEILITGVNSDFTCVMDELKVLSPDLFVVNWAESHTDETFIWQVNLLAQEISHGKILLISNDFNQELVFNTIHSGRIIYVNKYELENLDKLLLNIYHKVSPYEIIAKKFAIMKRELLLSILTPAERELFDFVEQNRCKLSELPDKMFKSSNTLRTHIKNINKKFNTQCFYDALLKVTPVIKSQHEKRTSNF